MMTTFDAGAWMLAAMALAIALSIAREALFRFELWRHGGRCQMELDRLREAVDDPGALLDVDDELASLNAPLRVRWRTPVERREAFDLAMGGVSILFVIAAVVFACTAGF